MANGWGSGSGYKGFAPGNAYQKAAIDLSFIRKLKAAREAEALRIKNEEKQAEYEADVQDQKDAANTARNINYAKTGIDIYKDAQNINVKNALAEGLIDGDQYFRYTEEYTKANPISKMFYSSGDIIEYDPESGLPVDPALDEKYLGDSTLDWVKEKSGYNTVKDYIAENVLGDPDVGLDTGGTGIGEGPVYKTPSDMDYYPGVDDPGVDSPIGPPQADPQVDIMDEYGYLEQDDELMGIAKEGYDLPPEEGGPLLASTNGMDDPLWIDSEMTDAEYDAYLDDFFDDSEDIVGESIGEVESSFTGTDAFTAVNTLKSAYDLVNDWDLQSGRGIDSWKDEARNATKVVQGVNTLTGKAIGGKVLPWVGVGLDAYDLVTEWDMGGERGIKSWDDEAQSALKVAGGAMMASGFGAVPGAIIYAIGTVWDWTEDWTMEAAGNIWDDSMDYITARTKGQGQFTNWNNPAKWSL